MRIEKRYRGKTLIITISLFSKCFFNSNKKKNLSRYKFEKKKKKITFRRIFFDRFLYEGYRIVRYLVLISKELTQKKYYTSHDQTLLITRNFFLTSMRYNYIYTCVCINIYIYLYTYMDIYNRRTILSKVPPPSYYVSDKHKPWLDALVSS